MGTPYDVLKWRRCFFSSENGMPEAGGEHRNPMVFALRMYS